MNRSSKSALVRKPAPSLQGKVNVGASTKALLHSLPEKRIAVLKHRDLDEVSAQDLIDRKVKAIINCAPTMSGVYPAMGPLLLLKHKIPVWEAEPEYFDAFADNDEVMLYDDKAMVNDRVVPCRIFTREEWLYKHRQAQANIHALLDSFIENTITHALQDKAFVLTSLPPLQLKTSLEHKHALVVSRGSGYKKDLQALHDYVKDYTPVLIGVDGGADALLAHGYVPDIIIGDMDSVSDRALTRGAELIVHAYPNGEAPGLARLQQMGLNAHILPSVGTSEDIALLLAYEQDAEFIVSLGAHSHMIDFLEKGRPGMGSTMLVRMKIGAKLMDAKGVSTLYRKTSIWKKDAFITLLLSCLFVAASYFQLRWVMKHVVKVVWEVVR